MSGALPIKIRNASVTGFLGDGHKNVSVAGTAEVLTATSTPCNMICIQAKGSNGGEVFVGGENVTNNYQGGISLRAYESLILYAENLTQIYVDSTVNGEGVTYTYWGN